MTLSTTETIPAPMTLGELLRAVWRDLKRCFAALVAFEVIFKALVGVVFLPTLALLLFALVRWSGRTALTNEDILAFVLSPWGVLYGFLAGLKMLGVALFEHAGITAVAALKRTGNWHGFRHAMVALATRVLSVLQLTALMLVIAAAGLAPFAGLAALTYSRLLGQQDINYYLTDRPPNFYIACGIGAALLLAALAVAACLYTRWSFSLCVLLMEGRAPIPAMAVSAERTRGIRWRIGAVLVTWQLIGLGLQLLVMAAVKLVAGWALAGAGPSPRAALPVVLTLLALHGLMAAAVAAFVVAVHCLLILRMYVHRGLRLGVLDEGHWGDELDVQPARPGQHLARLEWGVAAVVVLFVAVLLGLTGTLEVGQKVEVAAHRGYSAVAPENTLAAIQKAIDVGADWAEIDVQLTRDGEVVLMHDRDLMKMTGDARRVSELTLAQWRDLKLLKRYGEEFASERLPTLQEVIDLTRDRMKLSIELKFYGKDRKDRTLAHKVCDLIKKNGLEDDCVVTSLKEDGVLEAKRYHPGVKTGMIVTVEVGDISRLDVDLLSVRLGLATDDLLRKAKRLNKQVHVWTVNDRRTMRRLLDRGVNGVITDQPELFLELRKEHDELGDAQKLVMACRHLLK